MDQLQPSLDEASESVCGSAIRKRRRRLQDSASDSGIAVEGMQLGGFGDRIRVRLNPLIFHRRRGVRHCFGQPSEMRQRHGSVHPCRIGVNG
jgi:hypothetical protein